MRHRFNIRILAFWLKIEKMENQIQTRLRYMASYDKTPDDLPDP